MLTSLNFILSCERGRREGTAEVDVPSSVYGTQGGKTPLRSPGGQAGWRLGLSHVRNREPTLALVTRIWRAGRSERNGFPGAGVWKIREGKKKGWLSSYSPKKPLGQESPEPFPGLQAASIQSSGRKS